MPTKTAAFLLLPLAACFGSTTTEFPPGLEPLEDNEAALPDEGGLGLANGEFDHYIWLHGRALVDGAPEDVWTALQEPATVVAVCAADRSSFELTEDPQYELSLLIHYAVEEIITVEWDEQWRYGAIDESRWMIRYQKVFGSELIRVLEGSIQVLATDDPEVSELALVEHLEAAGGDLADMRTSMQHRYDSVLAFLAGQEQPTCP